MVGAIRRNSGPTASGRQAARGGGARTAGAGFVAERMFAEADDPPCEPHQRDRADHEERRAPRQPVISAATIGGVTALPSRENECVKPCTTPRRSRGNQWVIARAWAGSVAPSPMPSSSRAANSSRGCARPGGEGGDDPDQPAADQRDAGAEPVGDPAAADLADCIRIRERGECDAEFGIRQAEFGLDRAGCGREVDAVDVEDAHAATACGAVDGGR